MNNLSLLIYLAGVTGSIGSFLVFVAVLFGFGIAVCGVVWVVSLDATNFRTVEYANHVKTHSWRWLWAFLALMIFTGSASALVPSRQTVLLIAGSEMGERVLNHPKFNQVVDPGLELVTTWMQKETAEIRKSMEPAKKQ